jgi:hypothetical protein
MQPMRPVLVACCLLGAGCQFAISALSPVGDTDGAVLVDASMGQLPDGAPPRDQSMTMLTDGATLTDSAMPPAPDMASLCKDGKQDGDETDKDCGGSCPACADGKMCMVGNDCTSMHCINNKCAPACTKSSMCGPDQYCLGNGNCDPISNGLIGWWKFDEAMWMNDCAATQVADSSGNNHNGMSCPSNAGPTMSVAGKFGKAVSFNGGIAWIQIPPDAVFEQASRDFSLSFWVNMSFNALENVVYDDFGDDYGHIWLIHRGGNGWSFEQRVHMSNTNTVIVAEGGDATPQGQWAHVALVRSGAQWNIYVNGTSVANANMNIPVIAGTGPRFGYGQDDVVGWDGSIDDFRIYSRALSADEVAAFSR